MTIELVLPWPPSVNAYKKIGGMTRTKTGKLFQRRVDTNETKAFYFQVYQIIKAQIGWKRTPMALDSTIRLSVSVSLYPPPSTAVKRWDADNRLKVLLDSLTRSGLIADDSQITRLLVEKMSPFPNGKAVVTIEVLDHAHE